MSNIKKQFSKENNFPGKNEEENPLYAMESNPRAQDTLFGNLVGKK